MLTYLLTRHTEHRPTFYRVAVEYNLFGEYSVMREWGPKGAGGHQMLAWFSNLRDACAAADTWRNRAQRRGYVIEGAGL